MEWFRGGTALEVILVRLDAGEDLQESLAQLTRELDLGAAIVLSGQGMLARARFVGAGEILLEKPGPLRIVSLQGTLFGGSVDLTLTLARSGEPFAGGVRAGCVVEPAAECALLRLGQLHPVRVPDAAGVPRLQMGDRAPPAEPIMLMGQPIDPGALTAVPRSLIQRHRALPIQRSGRALIVAMADVRDFAAIEDFRLASGLQVQPVAVPRAELEAAIARLLSRPQ